MPDEQVSISQQIQVNCTECEKIFLTSIKEFTSNQHHFCTPVCFTTWQENPRVIKQCLDCNTNFVARVNDQQIYCSNTCQKNYIPKQKLYRSHKAGLVFYIDEWDLKRMVELDVDQNVLTWSICNDVIPWQDDTGKSHNHSPRFLIRYSEYSVVEDINGWNSQYSMKLIDAVKIFYAGSTILYRVISNKSENNINFPIKLVSYENDVGVHRRLSYETIWMRLAVSLADRSTCLRRQVGAVVTDKDMTRALCIGYNGDHAGGDNQCDSLVPGHCGCTHAEINTFSKSVSDLTGCTLFITLAPCKACAKVIINRKISRVIYFADYRSNEGLELLRKMSITVVKYRDLS